MNRFSSTVWKTAEAAQDVGGLENRKRPHANIVNYENESFDGGKGENRVKIRSGKNIEDGRRDIHTARSGATNDADDHEELLDDASEIYMALSFSNNTLGLACYHEARNTILLNSYQLSSGDADNVLRMIKQTMSPTLFLLHPNILMNIGLHRLIIKPLDDDEDEVDDENVSSLSSEEANHRRREREYPYKSLKTSSWQEYKLVGLIHEVLQVGHYRRESKVGYGNNNRSTSINATIAQNLPYEDDEDNNRGRYNKSNAHNVYTGIDLYNLLTRTVDMDKIQVRQSFVALITFLKDSIFEYLLDEHIVLNDILPFPDHAYVQIDQNTFHALQIFCEDIHPNWIRGKGKNKEGFSLFGLFDRTKSLIGRKKLKEWMLKPFLNREKIISRQQGIEFIMNDKNRESMKVIGQHLKHFSDISQVVVRIKKAQSSFKDWCKLHTSLVTGTKILAVLLTMGNSQSIDEDSKIFIEGVLNAVDIDAIAMLADRLSAMLDFVESERQHRVIIAKGIDEELDEKRMLFDELEDVMFMTATEILKAVPVLERLKVEYFPQLGYLVAVEDIYAEVLRTEGYIAESSTTAEEGHQQLEDDEYKQRKDQVDQYAEDDMLLDHQEGNSRSPIPMMRSNRDKPDQDQNRSRGFSLMDPDSAAFLVDNDDDERDYANYPQSHHDPHHSQARQNKSVMRIPIPEEDQFSIVYTQDNIVYFKHYLVRRLDQEIGDISSDIMDRQKAILLGLEEEIVQYELEIVALYHTLAELDAYLSLGEMAIQHHLVKPQIVEDSIIAIKGGRHLLQELTVDHFIANDTFVSSSDRNIALITGPNASGKSIYLKQVGLITYLAHIGSFVPCEQAIIGLTDRILTRIASNDSVTNPQSTFTIDLNQISKMMKFVTPRSLCLIDEFGKGTSPIDGMSLLVGVLRHFATWKGNVLCALHFSEVLHEEILGVTTMKAVNFFRMETLKEDDGSSVISSSSRPGTTSRPTNKEDDNVEDPDSLIPLYKLKHGIERSSQGILCAERMGIKKSIILRAKALKIAIEHKDIIDRLWSLEEKKELEIYEELLQVLKKIHDFYMQGNPYAVSTEERNVHDDGMKETGDEIEDRDESEREAREKPRDESGMISEKQSTSGSLNPGEVLVMQAQELYQQLEQIRLSIAR